MSMFSDMLDEIEQAQIYYASKSNICSYLKGMEAGMWLGLAMAAIDESKDE